MSNTPILFSKKEDCCGCAACQNICPRNAIKMEIDEMGFLYPVIDPDKCINCQQCIRICILK